MQDDSPGEVPKTIWLNQPTETPTMTAKLVQQRSRYLRARTRRKLFGILAGPLASGFFYAYSIREFPSLRQILHPLFFVALAWSFAGLYFLNRGLWPAMMPGDAGLRNGLEFCRKEIERQREFVRRALLWSFGPMLLAISAFILALVMVSTRDRGIFPNGLPFITGIVVWIVVYFISRLREQRELKAELDDLDGIQKEDYVL